MDKNYGLIITAVVAIAAILSLVANFSGGLSGLLSLPRAQSSYVPLEGYSPSQGITASDYSVSIGEEIGRECLSWTVSQDSCCALSCDDVCEDGNCWRDCKSSCQKTIKAYYGY